MQDFAFGIAPFDACLARITEGKVADLTVAQQLKLPKGSLVVMDRGYTDYYMYERWQIELFFKAIKRNLRVKTFVGTSANAVRIQIWTALIAILLIKYLQFKSRMSWALSNLVALLRWNLFTHRNLWKWINAPFIYSNPQPEDELTQPVLDGIPAV